MYIGDVNSVKNSTVRFLGVVQFFRITESRSLTRGLRYIN